MAAIGLPHLYLREPLNQPSEETLAIPSSQHADDQAKEEDPTEIHQPWGLSNRENSQGTENSPCYRATTKAWPLHRAGSILGILLVVR